MLVSAHGALITPDEAADHLWAKKLLGVLGTGPRNQRKNSREHEKPALSRWLIGFGGTPGARASRIPHGAVVPPLLFANRNQFICVIDGAG